MERCGWAEKHELETVYHDNQWGVPEHNDQQLFKMLMLEANQAGLSWLTILKKEAQFDEAYDQWDYRIIATYDDKKIEELLNNPGIIRNSLKIKAAINNAQKFMAIQEEFGSFDTYIWSFVNHQPIINHWQELSEVPPSTELSDKISKDLKKRGFKFLGSTTIYAYMQSIGLVNDHIESCFRKKLCQ
ncbi:DNA-3-methyladenine glycosylase [Enterococcus sp. JM4C]|uniref:DNA-3-methyladenine glycosylase I n=1 Tax=Candidatus Enterococcus huntleyi TaxID=1857217 RepID=UPI00137AF841|nr:DNA-3-methyladenine glycosylase I [Enterococcus sp. JM4C]KAF1297897.1 DNA-3-methyladenine glycosylase [Enterococcus sp. JM4C]